MFDDEDKSSLRQVSVTQPRFIAVIGKAWTPLNVQRESVRYKTRVHIYLLGYGPTPQQVNHQTYAV